MGTEIRFHRPSHRSYYNIMKQQLGLLVLALAFAAVFATDCQNLPDGNYEIGCRSFTRCTGAVVKIVDCDMGQVYNNKTGSCDDPTNVPPPCGVMKDCTNAKDGKFADMEQHCHSYYSCYKGEFLGHNICPASLVFNEVLQTCDWAENVAPPCGTKTGP